MPILLNPAAVAFLRSKLSAEDYSQLISLAQNGPSASLETELRFLTPALSSRTLNALSDHDITTLGHIGDYLRREPALFRDRTTEDVLLRITQFGVGCLNELKIAISQSGWSLDDLKSAR